MKRFLVLLSAVGVGVVCGRLFDASTNSAEAGGGGENCVSQNGDVNADGTVNLTDAVTILEHLFRANPPDLVPFCDSTRKLEARVEALETDLAECRAENCPPFGLPDTGQTSCYDSAGNVVDCEGESCGGQDGLYDTGCPAEDRFVDNGDGTVTDGCTGLMWQNGPDVFIFWCDALTYCEDLELAGHDDWRLPNVRELRSLLDYGRRTGIDPLFGTFSDLEDRPGSGMFWSSTTRHWTPEEAWYVTLPVGNVFHAPKDRRVFGVRAVRTVRDPSRREE